MNMDNYHKRHKPATALILSGIMMAGSLNMPLTANAESSMLESNYAESVCESEYTESYYSADVQNSEYAESMQESEYAESVDSENIQKSAEAESNETREYAYDMLLNGAAYTEDEVFGDTNNDGDVDATDAYNILVFYSQVSVGLSSNVYVKNWDVDYNGEIGVNDAYLVLIHYAKVAVGEDDPWPPQKEADATTEPVTTTESVQTTTTVTTTQSVEATTQSVATTTQSVDTTTQPVDTTTQPVDTTTQPVDTTTQPVDTTIQLVETTTELVQTTVTTTTASTVETTTTFVGDYKVGDVIVFTGVHWNIRSTPSLEANTAEVGLETNYMFKIISTVDEDWAYGISISPDKDLTKSEIGFVKVNDTNFKKLTSSGSLQIGDVMKFTGKSWNLRSSLDELSGEYLDPGNYIVVVDYIVTQNNYEWYWVLNVNDSKTYVVGYSSSVFYKTSDNFFEYVN